jgi:hypothetical protein
MGLSPSSAIAGIAGIALETPSKTKTSQRKAIFQSMRGDKAYEAGCLSVGIMPYRAVTNEKSCVKRQKSSIGAAFQPFSPQKARRY